MKEIKQMPTLDKSATYQIKVPGHLEGDWTVWVDEMTVEIGSNNDGLPISSLTGSFDQAALLGLLRRLNALGLPLISVNCLEA